MQSAAPTMRRSEKRLVYAVLTIFSKIVVPQPSVRAGGGNVQRLECMLYMRLRDGFRILFLFLFFLVGGEVLHCGPIFVAVD